MDYSPDADKFGFFISAGFSSVAWTRAEGAGAAAPHEVERFTADHPFLLLIVDQSSRLILFMGRVTDPA